MMRIIPGYQIHNEYSRPDDLKSYRKGSICLNELTIIMFWCTIQSLALILRVLLAPVCTTVVVITDGLHNRGISAGLCQSPSRAIEIMNNGKIRLGGDGPAPSPADERR